MAAELHTATKFSGTVLKSFCVSRISSLGIMGGLGAGFGLGKGSGF